MLWSVSKLARLGLRALIMVLPCAFSTTLIAQQRGSTAQLPEAIRGARIYQLPTKGGHPAPNPAIYKSVSFRDINFDRLLLGLSVSINPVDRPATVLRMYFQDVAVNGMPVHIETFDQEFKLSNKAAVDVPAPLKCTIVFADLDSMKPVRDLVDKDKIQITGQSFIEVKLNSLEKLALRAKQVVIPVNLNEQVPLNLFQGNPLLHMTADTILDTLANPASAAAVNMAKEHLAKVQLDATVGAKAKSALYMLYTEYTVRDPQTKASEQFSQSGTGFLVSIDGKLLTAKRLIAPWKFDPQVDFLIEHQHLEVDKSSIKTFAWPVGAQVRTVDGQPNYQSALSMEKQSLKILQTSPDKMVQQDYRDPDSDERATLHLHADGMSDWALLQITGTGFQPLTFPNQPATFAADSRFVLCSLPFGASQAQITPRLRRVQVSSQGNDLKMEQKADPGESGAPLLDTEGNVVAMATSADQCIPIEGMRRLIP